VTSKRGDKMFVVAGVVKAAAGAQILTGARPAKKPLPRIKRKLVVGAVALFILAALAALIPASDTPNAENSSAATTNSQSVTEAPVSEPGAAPQMNEEEALDAYKKLPLSFIPNKGQTEEAVRYYAQGAGYGFFFTPKTADV
jgi:putative Ca2+/H+ antiporter (TMEM165/GDT1 family)